MEENTEKNKGKEFTDFGEKMEELQKETGLSPMKQAENLINRLEENKTVFTDDERNLIVNYAFQTGDMDKTTRFAEQLFQEKEQKTGKAFHVKAEAQAEIDAIAEYSNKEKQLLYGDTDQYGIYQLKDSPELDQYRFAGTEALKRMGITKYNFESVKPENYDLVYTGNLEELKGKTQTGTLDNIYEKLNIDHPADYRGHSLSVSDIVVLHENGENSTHFVDSFGFTGVPEFTRALEDRQKENNPLAKIEEQEEQNFNMIDGMLNNGAEKQNQEAEARQSLKERLTEKQRKVVETAVKEPKEKENTRKNQREH